MPASYQVQFTKSATKEYSTLPRKTQDKIAEALQFLSTNPFSELLKVKKSKGADALYRIRIGDYRVVYEIRLEILLIIVIKIGHRREVYRGV